MEGLQQRQQMRVVQQQEQKDLLTHLCNAYAELGHYSVAGAATLIM